MSKDYAPTAAKAKDMIANYGRTVTLRKPVETTEAGKPWRGTTAANTPVAADKEATVKAVFIGPSKALSDDFLTDVEDVAIVAGPVDYSDYRLLFDGTTAFKIIRQQKVQPGDTIILTYLGVAR